MHVPSAAAGYGGTGAQPQIAFVSSGATVLGSVEASTGNWFMKGSVGVGNASPTEAMHFAPSSYLALPSNGGSYIPASYRGTRTGIGPGGGIILAGSANAAGTPGTWGYGSRIVNNDYGDGLALSFDTVHANTWTNDVLVVGGRATCSGCVGIGTANPQAKLDVNGPIRSNGVTMPVCGWFTPTHSSANSGCNNECQNFSAMARAAGWNRCVPRAGSGSDTAGCGGRQWYINSACSSGVNDGSYTYFETRFTSLSSGENTAGGGGALYLRWTCCNDIVPSFWCCQ